MRTSKLVSFAAVVLALSSFRASADDVKWIGGATGRWSDGANWSKKAPPDKDDFAHFPMGASCTVDLEGAEVNVQLLYVGTEGDGNLEESPVVLTGGGKLATTIISRVFENRKLVLDGVETSFGGSQFTIRDGARLVLRNGASISSSTFYVNTNAVLDIDSGAAVGRLTMLGRSHLRMREGGSLTLTKGPSIDATATFDVTGGRIVSDTENVVQANNIANFATGKLNGAVELGFIGADGTRSIFKDYTKSTWGTVSVGDDTAIEILGGGTNALTLSEVAAEPCVARSFSVGEGTSPDLTTAKNSGIYYIFRNLAFGSHSTNSFDRIDARTENYNNWFVATETSVVDPTAVFKVRIGAAPTSGTTYPLLTGAIGGSVLSPEQFELVPAETVDLTGWEVKCIGPVVYLTDGQYTPATASDQWIGGFGGNWSEDRNWADGWDGTALTFTGEASPVVTNDTTVSKKALRFSATCAPFVLRGNKISMNRSMDGFGSSAAFRSLSHYPVVFELPIEMTAAPNSAATVCGISVDDLGPLAFLGGLNLGARKMKMCGNVMIGSVATLGTLEFAAPADAARGTALHVLSNGNVTVSAQANEIATTASIFVAKDGVMTYAGGAFTYGTVENVHAVDGLLDIQCPFSGTCGITFLGEGTVKLAQVVAPAEGTSVVTLKGGITLEPGSWETEAVSLAVAENGTASIKVDEAFTLNCALTSGVRSHLRKTGAGTLNFSKAYVFPGEFNVVEGTIGVTGDLAAAAEEGFVDVLTAKELTGDIAVPDGWRFKLAANPDGSMTLKAGKKLGLMLIFR